MQDLSAQIIRAWRDRVGPKLLPLLSTVRLGGLVLAGLALWGFAEIADEVLEKETQAFDTTILLSLRELHNPLLDRLMIAITFLGEPTELTIMSLALGAWLLWRGQRSEATTLAIAAAGAAGLNVLLKDVFARARPALWARIVDVRYYSFPSGHAMLSVVVYGLLGYLLATHFKRWRVGILISIAVLIAAIGFSRLYLGVHWPTDVLAGYAAGLVWLLTCILSIEIWRHRGTMRTQEAARPKSTSIK
ncbi:phosphatase PAP2 family protein [Trichocoleus desertorum AS-A10]|uniref:phosphatase PAP2 family protein n=1 Tax=Trichocoleus desertorum TaxID=1481672 RepID=UPI0032993E27